MRKTKNIKALEAIAVVCKQLRAEKGVTQLQVKIDTGVNISRIEASQYDITIGTIYALCDYFDISVAEFFQMVERATH